jgi:hypothetical protein
VSETPGSQLNEEPQQERGAPGSRDTGSNQPGGGPVDRPEGTVDDGPPTTVDPQEPSDPRMPNAIGDSGTVSDESRSAGAGELAPQDTGRAVPPYEGRRTSAEVDTETDSTRAGGARVGGALGPVADEAPKAPDPADTARGAVASPADEQPAEDEPETESSAPDVGPSHSVGVRRAEDQ